MTEALLLEVLQEVRVLLVGRLLENGLLPQVWRQVAESVRNGVECRFGEVAQSGSLTTRTGPAVLNTSHGQELLWHRRANETSTTRGRDQSHGDRTALASDLARHSVWSADLVTPVASSHRHDRELGEDDGASDGRGDFLGDLDAETDVTVVVTDGNDGLEASSLTGLGLLLNWLDLENLVLQHRWLDESVNDLSLLDGQREQVDLLERGDLALLDQSAELGDWVPATLALVLAATAWRTASTTAASTATTTTSVTSATTAAATSALASEARLEAVAASGATFASCTTSRSTSIGWSCIRHVCDIYDRYT